LFLPRRKMEIIFLIMWVLNYMELKKIHLVIMK